MNTCWSHSNKEILKPQPQKFTSSCKSFVLSICFPPFFLLHDLCDVPAPPAGVVLLYLETLSWAFLLSWFSGGLLSFHLMGQKERQTVFILHHRVHQRSRFSWSAPLSVKMAMRAYFPSPGSSPTKHLWRRGAVLHLCSTLLPQVDPSREGSQPKLSAWAGKSKNGQSCQEISCQNLKYNNLPELLEAPTEIRPQLSAVLCEHMYCVCVCIYIHQYNETLLILESQLCTQTKVEERK